MLEQWLELGVVDEGHSLSKAWSYTLWEPSSGTPLVLKKCVGLLAT